MRAWHADALIGPVRRLSAEGLPADVVEAFATAAVRHASVVSTTVADRPRKPEQEDAAPSPPPSGSCSSCSDALPRTGGRFTLNAKLGFCFGGGAAEIDLCAESLRLAVEVDGYHHFTDPDAYRRDRRKDWELQRHGYVVLRVLAADVVERMEEGSRPHIDGGGPLPGKPDPGHTTQGGDARRDRDRLD